MDYNVLLSEIENDPLNLGYAPLVEAGNGNGLADVLNATTGPGSATVVLTSVARNDFLAAIRPAYLSLPILSAALQTKWDRILDAINTTTSNVTIDATTKLLLAAAVADNVLTQEQADAVWHRTGSRAEVLFGPDIRVTSNDIARAFGRNV